MSGDKTEKATPRKRREARKEGQVLRSTEANTAFCCVVMFGLMIILWPWFTDEFRDIFMEYLGSQSLTAFAYELNRNAVLRMLPRIMFSLLGVLFPILGAAMVSGLAINLLQVGFMFTTKPLGMKLNRINPLNGFKRMFSLNSLVDMLKSLAKIALLGYIAYSDYKNLLFDFPGYVGIDIYDAFLSIMNTAWGLALKMSLVMIVIAAMDYLYQWFKYEKDLRMTKQEVKDEYKLMEGDPQIKGKIRAKQRQISAMRMMAAVPEADVVITNPTHYAIALKYDDKVSRAPVVIAKGQDYLARKIKEVAAEHNIEIIENKPLAQSLYALCEVDDEIPAEFYQAVADILVFVYKQKGRVR